MRKNRNEHPLLEKTYAYYLQKCVDEESELPFFDSVRDIQNAIVPYNYFIEADDLAKSMFTEYIKTIRPKLSDEEINVMWHQEKYPCLYGVSLKQTKILNSMKDVADFICENGVAGDVCVFDPDGDIFLDTYGLYINKIADKDYLTLLLKVLAPLQQKIEAKLLNS